MNILFAIRFENLIANLITFLISIVLSIMKQILFLLMDPVVWEQDLHRSYGVAFYKPL